MLSQPAAFCPRPDVMRTLKNLIHEIHRRSLWQVLGAFLAGSVGLVEFVDLLTELVGLPDWAPLTTLVVLLIGLPVVLATAYVQKGLPGGRDDQQDAEGLTARDDAAPAATPVSDAGRQDGSAAGVSPTRRLLTWRNVMLAGVGSFALLGLSLAVYFVMWTSGIGPVGNLVAQGVLAEKDPVVLADFADDTGEDLGEVVTEALRVDLLESSVLSIVTAGQLSEELALMGEDPEVELTPGIAREVARRGGFKAYIRGEIAPAGGAYVLTAAVVSAESGDELKGFRVTARSGDQLVDAIDELSQDIREGVGESLRTIRAGQPLERATTSSFEALRRYTAAQTAEERGRTDEALRLLEEAVELDPAFASAYRSMGILYGQAGELERSREATRRAYELRDRLTDRERYLAEALYYGTVVGDVAAEEAAYRDALRVAPDDGPAMNNLALILMDRGDYGEAIELFDRAVAGAGASPPAYLNRLRAHFHSGSNEAIERTHQAYIEAYPEHGAREIANIYRAAALGDLEEFDAINLRMESAPPWEWRGLAAMVAGTQDIARGRWREGLRHMEQAAVMADEDDRPDVATRRRLIAKVTLTVQLTGDTATAAAAMETLIRDFDSLQGPVPPWAARVDAHLSIGDVPGARDAIERWEAQVGDNTLFVARAGLERAKALILLAEGEPEISAREFEAQRRELRCSSCSRPGLAETYVQTGRAEDAVELLLEEQAFRDNIVLYPTRWLQAAKQLGPLLESLGDTTAAVEQYRMIVDAWGEGDPELRPAARRAKERIDALGG